MSWTEDLSADAVVALFMKLDLKKPRIDRAAVEVALRCHMSEVNDDPTRPIRWIDSAKEAYRYMLGRNSLDRVCPVWQEKVKACRQEAVCALDRMGIDSRSLLGMSPDVSTISRVMETGASRIARGAAWRQAELQSGGLDPDDQTNDVSLNVHAGSWLASRNSGAFDPVEAALWYVAIAARTAGCRQTSWKNACRYEQAVLGVAKLWRPLVMAAAAGLFLYWITEEEFICLQRPALFTSSGCLHRENGPAVHWTADDCYHFWHGIRIPSRFVERPEMIAIADIRKERNVGVQLLLIERYGRGRLIDELGGKPVATDRWGKLWRPQLNISTMFAIVEVENGTVERHSAARQRYFLCVPGSMNTPREAVAWSYGLTPEQYELVVRS